MEPLLSPSSPDYNYADDVSNCSSPYVSAPSSPSHTFISFPAGFFYSAPASPMHYVLSSAATPAISSLLPTASDASSTGSFEFDFSGDRVNSPAPETAMSSADELFSNGLIKPTIAHFAGELEITENRDVEDQHKDEDETFRRSRNSIRFRDRSQRRRARSMSPLRYSDEWLCSDEKTPETRGDAAAQEGGRSFSRRWDFLKDFLRSKSEGRSKFWRKERERERERERLSTREKMRGRKTSGEKESPAKKKVETKRRSVHEMRYYEAKRAEEEERRKRTFLPYRQGVLGCFLGFNSKGYGAVNGFATALDPLSSR